MNQPNQLRLRTDEMLLTDTIKKHRIQSAKVRYHTGEAESAPPLFKFGQGPISDKDKPNGATDFIALNKLRVQTYAGPAGIRGIRRPPIVRARKEIRLLKDSDPNLTSGEQEFPTKTRPSTSNPRPKSSNQRHSSAERNYGERYASQGKRVGLNFHDYVKEKKVQYYDNQQKLEIVHEKENHMPRAIPPVPPSADRKTKQRIGSIGGSRERAYSSSGARPGITTKVLMGIQPPLVTGDTPLRNNFLNSKTPSQAPLGSFVNSQDEGQAQEKKESFVLQELANAGVEPEVNFSKPGSRCENQIKSDQHSIQNEETLQRRNRAFSAGRYDTNSNQGGSQKGSFLNLEVTTAIIPNKNAGNGIHTSSITPLRGLTTQATPTSNLLTSTVSCNSTSLISPIVSSQLKDYQFGKQLGVGAYALVKQCVHKKTKMTVAMKIYDKYKLTDAARKKSVQREIYLLRKLDHQNVVKFYDTFDTRNTVSLFNVIVPQQINIIMENVQGKSLYQILKEKKDRKLPENEVKKIFRQLVKAIDYLHSKNVAHRDLKLENILVTNEGVLKLIDFGFSVCSDKKLRIFCGTPSYMAPEIILRKDYFGPPTDVWSLGVLLYAMLNGRFPFKGTSEKDLYRKITKGNFVFPDEMQSQDAKNLIRKMLNIDYARRATSSELLRDKWFSSD